MGGHNRLVEGMGGAEWLAATGVRLDGRAANTRDMVGLVLPANRSACGATHATVYRKTEAEGGGFLLRWWVVTGAADAEDVGEFEAGELARLADAIGDDLRRAAAAPPVAA